MLPERVMEQKFLLIVSIFFVLFHLYSVQCLHPSMFGYVLPKCLFLCFRALMPRAVHSSFAFDCLLAVAQAACMRTSCLFHGRVLFAQEWRYGELLLAAPSMSPTCSKLFEASFSSLARLQLHDRLTFSHPRDRKSVV